MGMRPLILAVALVLATGTSVWARSSDLPPDPPTDPIGDLRWLPPEAEQQAITGRRLVFVYDTSVDGEGEPVPLRARGGFAVTVATNTAGQLNVIHHSPSVAPVRGRTDNPVVEFLGVFADWFASAWAGDVRDGDCAMAGMPSFSAAYTSLRTFFHPGSDAYPPVSAPGRCEVVLDSERVQGGYRTTVRTFVPGFWLDVHYSNQGELLPHGDELPSDIWYEAAYDEDGESGGWYETFDAVGTSVPVDHPKRYDAVFDLSANPGAVGPNCPGDPVGLAASAPGSWVDQPVDVPVGTKRVTFTLLPRGHWNLRIIDPSGEVADSADVVGTKRVTVPGAGFGDIDVLRPGRFVLRACNYAGEPTARAAVTFA